jgi:hypothetical protein
MASGPYEHRLLPVCCPASKAKLLRSRPRRRQTRRRRRGQMTTDPVTLVMVGSRRMPLPPTGARCCEHDWTLMPPAERAVAGSAMRRNDAPGRRVSPTDSGGNYIRVSRSGHAGGCYGTPRRIYQQKRINWTVRLEGHRRAVARQDDDRACRTRYVELKDCQPQRRYGPIHHEGWSGDPPVDQRAAARLNVASSSPSQTSGRATCCQGHL